MAPAGISSLSSTVGPSIPRTAGSSVRFTIVKVAMPAPNSLGERITASSETSTLTSNGSGGLGSFSKSSRPHAPSVTAAAATATATSPLALLLAMR